MAKKRSREGMTLDLTPLIDMMFLLLIFFLVSTVFKTQETVLGLQLPETQSGQQKTTPQKEEKIILVELDGSQLIFNGKVQTLSEFEESLKVQTNQTGEQQKQIEFRIDKSVSYEKVVEVLDLLKKYKLNQISLVTKQK